MGPAAGMAHPEEMGALVHWQGKQSADGVFATCKNTILDIWLPLIGYLTFFCGLMNLLTDSKATEKMSRILTPSHIDPADFDEVVNFLDQNVTFIGIQDVYPLSFSIMFGLLGMNRNPRVHERKTQSTDTNDVMLSQELQSRIRSINDLDHRLFRHYRQLLASIREQWHEYKIRADQPASEQ